eukprot:85644_1
MNDLSQSSQHTSLTDPLQQSQTLSQSLNNNPPSHPSQLALHSNNNSNNNDKKKKRFSGKRRKLSEDGSFVNDFMLPSIEDSQQPAKEIKIKLHPIFAEASKVLNKLMLRTFKLRIARNKRIATLDLIITKNPKVVDDASYTQLNTSIIAHPLLNERYQKNMAKLTRVVNFMKLSQAISCIDKAIEVTKSDISAVITAATANYGRLRLGQQAIDTDWCPVDYEQKLDPMTNDKNDQATLIVQRLHSYQLELEAKYSQLLLAKYLNLDYCNQWLKCQDRNKAKKLKQKIDNVSRHKREYFTRDFNNELDQAINLKIKQLYLQQSQSVVAFAPSYKVIRSRRDAIKIQINNKSKEKINLRKVPLNNIYESVKSIIKKQRKLERREREDRMMEEDEQDDADDEDGDIIGDSEILRSLEDPDASPLVIEDRHQTIMDSYPNLVGYMNRFDFESYDISTITL